MRVFVAGALLLCSVSSWAQTATRPAAACERLRSLSLSNVTIHEVEVVAAGTFTTASAGVRAALPLGAQSRPANIPEVPGRVTGATANLGLGYNGGRGIPAFNELPAFCRVTATLKPSAASDIRMETWFPVSSWNGLFRGTSPNGLGGIINFNAMAVALTDGFAVASTDTGHQGGDVAWMQIPEKVTDFAGRAMHETTVAGKAACDRVPASARRE